MRRLRRRARRSSTTDGSVVGARAVRAAMSSARRHDLDGGDPTIERGCARRRRRRASASSASGVAARATVGAPARRVDQPRSSVPQLLAGSGAIELEPDATGDRSPATARTARRLPTTQRPPFASSSSVTRSISLRRRRRRDRVLVHLRVLRTDTPDAAQSLR